MFQWLGEYRDGMSYDLTMRPESFIVMGHEKYLLNRHSSSVKLERKLILSYCGMWIFASCIKT